MLANKLDACKGKCLQPPGAEEGGKPWSGITLSWGLCHTCGSAVGPGGARTEGGRTLPPPPSGPRNPELLKGSLRGAWEDRRRKEGWGRWK